MVVFSGDLVYGGAPSEFDLFDEAIQEVLDRLGDHQSRPRLITVPGNHDLARPGELASEAIALKGLASNHRLREGLFSDEGRPYREFLDDTFRGYTEWQSRSIERGDHLAPLKKGLLPGDATYILENESGSAGVVALNSTWLQLGKGNYLGQLHLDTRQLLAITDNRPDDWVRSHDINLLVTHQPSNWLAKTSDSMWDNDIYPSGRFDLHLFGHMHEPLVTSIAHGGEPTRRYSQAASLFGLESYGQEDERRIQGYSMNRISVEHERRSFESWPRRLHQVHSGKMKLERDQDHDLNEDTGSFTISYTIERGIAQLATEGRPRSERGGGTVPLVAKRIDLETIRHLPQTSRAHESIRRLEQDRCASSLKRDKVVWLASEWGMAHDGFIATIREQLKIDRRATFRIDFNGTNTREALFSDLRMRLGATFQEVCEAIAESGPSIVIFDDVGLLDEDSTRSTDDIEDLARTVADFAPEVYIFIRSARLPRQAKFRGIELRALDEPDVAIFARESESGGMQYAHADAASKLFRHTDGVPSRLEDALRDLELTSLDDLLASDIDYRDSGVGAVTAPPALISAVSELRDSADKAEQRAYSLLLALSALPQGEQLSRLRRFLGPHPIEIAQARALSDRSLVNSVVLTTLDVVEADSASKALVVPRMVREYVRESIDEKTAKDIDHKALELYFGEKWTTGDIYNSPTGKRVRAALCDGYVIQNASTLIYRVSRRVFTTGSDVEKKNAIRLALAFVELLREGDHFRSAASFCEDILKLLEEFDEGGLAKELANQLTYLRFEYGRALRMCGRHGEARDVLEALELSELNKQQRLQAELGLALCLNSLGEDELAAEAAKRTISLNRKSVQALQAEVLIAGHITDDEIRGDTLRALLKRAEKFNSSTITNNILISLSKISGSGDRASGENLRRVLTATQSSDDFYNAARAIVSLANNPETAKTLGISDRERLIDVYHFLYHERLYSLFDRCHEGLWRFFEQENDHGNLLNLFRHSSFIWRLNGREVQEAKYLAKLAGMVKGAIAGGISLTDRDSAYFFMRLSMAIDEKANDSTATRAGDEVG